MLKENALIIKQALRLASLLKADTIMLHADALDGLDFPGRIPKKTRIILISKKRRLEIAEKTAASLLTAAKGHVTLPKTNMTRISLIKIAAMLAISQEMIEQNSKVLFVVGQPDYGPLDMLYFVDTSRESEVITGKGITKIASIIRPEVFQAILNIATELSDKGREGKPIGTIFVVGEHEKVLQLSRQMIMNPFQGYSEEDRNIMSPSIKETIREFSALDGAFIISEDGTIITAGRYLGAAVEDTHLPRGLGSRHMAAAGITSLTKAISFVISESSGDIRIFKDGRIIMHIEKAVPKK